jgi:hypothetical protein
MIAATLVVNTIKTKTIRVGEMRTRRRCGNLDKSGPFHRGATIILIYLFSLPSSIIPKIKRDVRGRTPLIKTLCFISSQTFM